MDATETILGVVVFLALALTAVMPVFRKWRRLSGRRSVEG
jgi:hypothetical protein